MNNVGSGNNNNNNSKKKQKQQQSEMSYEEFGTRKFLPTYPNQCVSIQVWSNSLILVAYEQDCSLRLFEKNDSMNVTRELICQKIDPYYYTKKKYCTLLSMDLDEEYIGSLCYVVKNTEKNNQRQSSSSSSSPRNHRGLSYILIMMSRDDFLLGESSSIGNNRQTHNHNTMNRPDDMNTQLIVIDIRDAVLNYFVTTSGNPNQHEHHQNDHNYQDNNHTNDYIDYRLLEILDFIETTGGDYKPIDIRTSPSIIACGNGRYLIEVSISLPIIYDLDHDYEDHNNNVHNIYRLVDRKFVLFSASIGAIVWMGDSTFNNENRKQEQVQEGGQQQQLHKL